jgi:pimeloyl-ACP methyl ester carboxylesterase
VPYLVWNGYRVFYRVAGEAGRPLLIVLPGNTASSANYSAELEHYGRRFRVAALDFLGTGGSDRLPVWPDDWGERGAAQVAAVAARLGAARYAVMGTRGGGYVALLAALWDSARVAAVVADSCVERLAAEDLEQVVHERDPEIHGMARQRGRPEAELFDMILGRGVLSLGQRLANRRLRAFWHTAHGPDWADVVAADGALHLRLAALGGWDPFAGQLGQICCPVLLTGSPADPLLPNLDEQQAAMAAQIPTCGRWLANAADHAALGMYPPGFRQAADAFLAAVRF